MHTTLYVKLIFLNTRYLCYKHFNLLKINNIINDFLSLYYYNIIMLIVDDEKCISSLLLRSSTKTRINIIIN